MIYKERKSRESCLRDGKQWKRVKVIGSKKEHMPPFGGGRDLTIIRVRKGKKKIEKSRALLTKNLDDAKEVSELRLSLERNMPSS